MAAVLVPVPVADSTVVAEARIATPAAVSVICHVTAPKVDLRSATIVVNKVICLVIVRPSRALSEFVTNASKLDMCKPTAPTRRSEKSLTTPIFPFVIHFKKSMVPWMLDDGNIILGHHDDMTIRIRAITTISISTKQRRILSWVPYVIGERTLLEAM